MTAPTPPSEEDPTAEPAYAARLSRLQGARWKQIIDVQMPYRWFLRRLKLGRTLDVGCGVGRNLANLGHDAVGVDHNLEAIAVCRRRGFVAYTTDEFGASADAGLASFDALLLSHVVEHMAREDAVSLVKTYLPYLRRQGRVVFITPQERGFASDATHIEFMDHSALRDISERCELVVERATSFPFPRAMGKLFIYNEFVVVATAH